MIQSVFMVALLSNGMLLTYDIGDMASCKRELPGFEIQVEQVLKKHSPGVTVDQVYCDTVEIPKVKPFKKETVR